MRKQRRAQSEDVDAHTPDVDLSKLSPDELRAYIAGLRELRDAMRHCDGECGRCSRGQSCGADLQED